ncbi:MAG TPA: DUF4349 domain-containing protein [Anaerolineales bacterium]|nr:DUF4349 domain-containing protein [Anaerolineales bacterium]
MKTKFFSIFLFVTLLVALGACSPVASRTAEEMPVAPSYGGAEPAMDAGYADVMPAQPYATAGAITTGEEGSLANSTSKEGQSNLRMVIYNANLSLVVADTTVAIKQISELAKEYGGFVVTSNLYENSYPIGNGNYQVYNAANIQIRVDSARLDEAMSQLKAMAVEVSSESISGQDITQEYTDLSSRLKNLQAAEAQLQKIMEEAKKTEDVLAVYNQLVATREQIEVIQGQMKYYEQAAALSSISIDLQPDVKTQPIEIPGWTPWVTVKESFEDLVVGLQGLVDLLIRLAICGGPALLIMFPVFWLARRWWRNNRPSKAQPKVEKPTAE